MDTYLDLIYRPLIIFENMEENEKEGEENIEEESNDSSSTNDDNDILTAEN